MARITTEDCLEHVENRFDLVIHATKRARDLMMGKYEAVVDRKNDKASVLALREIASGYRYIKNAMGEESFINPE